MTAKKNTTKTIKKNNSSKSSVFWTNLKNSVLLIIGTVISGFASMFLFVLKVAAMAIILTFPLLWCLQHMPFWISSTCLSMLNPISAYAFSCLLIATVIALIPESASK